MMKTIHLSTGIRFVLAVLRLSADIAEGFGKAVINILSKQYPTMLEDMQEDEQYRENAAASIGHKLVAIARKQLKYNDQDAYDAVQDLLTYLISSKYNFRAETKKGRPGAETWRQALGNIYSNMRTKAMSVSFKKSRSGGFTEEERYADMLWRKLQSEKGNAKYEWNDEDDEDLNILKKALQAREVDVSKIIPTKLRRKNIRDKTIDEAFGKRGEGGGEPEGGLGNIPQVTEKHDIPIRDNFLKSLDQIIPDFVRELDRSHMRTFEKTREFPHGLPAQRFLFEFIFEEGGSGVFTSSIKENMNQSTHFRDWLEEKARGAGPNAREARALLDRYSGRWSNFVGDTRKKLLRSIQEFTEVLPEHEYDQLWSEFFSDTTPKSIEEVGRRKELEDMKVQRDKDLRSLIRMIEKDKLGMLSTSEKSKKVSLEKKIRKEINEEQIEAAEDARRKYRKDYGEYEKQITKYQKDMSFYLMQREKFVDLPLEEQPKLKRPLKPMKPVPPKPEEVQKSVPSLDEQLKHMMAKAGKEIREEVEGKFKEQLQEEDDTENVKNILEEGPKKSKPEKKPKPEKIDKNKVQQRYEDIMNSSRVFGGAKFILRLKNELQEVAQNLGTLAEDDMYTGWTQSEVKELYNLLYHESMPSPHQASIAHRVVANSMSVHGLYSW
jgi:hypothetical protein